MKAAVDTAYIGVRVPSDIADDFKRIAGRHERSVSAELRKIIREHVESHPAECGEAGSRAA